MSPTSRGRDGTNLTRENSYYTARSALHHGDLRRAVTNQQSARINSAASRAAYTAWLEVRT